MARRKGEQSQVERLADAAAIGWMQAWIPDAIARDAELARRWGAVMRRMAKMLRAETRGAR